MLIPRIIHQLWKTEKISDYFVDFKNSWLHFHPGWDYKLWTDDDLRVLVQHKEPDLLQIFDDYTDNICRADVGRYLIMKHIGGLYVDLDFECFRPMDDLLGQNSMAIGLEPDLHVHTHAEARRFGLRYMLCPSLIASVPDHPFWNDVVAALRKSAGEAEILTRTGPFLLTRCYDAAPSRASICLLSAADIYPATVHDTHLGSIYNISLWEYKTRHSYALHHWAGTYYRAKVRIPPPPSKVPVLMTGRPQTTQACAKDQDPLISCILIVTKPFARIEPAIKCYQRQTYTNRELIIINCYGDHALYGDTLADQSIQMNEFESELDRQDALSLAMTSAAGDCICNWCEDDLYDLFRLEIQVGALLARSADACLLQRSIVWGPKSGRITIAEEGQGLNSLLIRQEAYRRDIGSERDPFLSIGNLLQYNCIVNVYEPRLYVVVGDAEDNHPERWRSIQGVHFECQPAARIERELGRHMPLASTARWFSRSNLTEFHMDRLEAKARSRD